MNGGEISDNIGGGGVWMEVGAFNMHGGKITNNKNYGTGGGGVSVLTNSTFTMTGGEISNNEAAARGGGVYVENSTFRISDGIITGTDAAGNDPPANTILFNQDGAALSILTGGIAQWGSDSGGWTPFGTAPFNEDRTIEVVDGVLIRPNGASSAMLELDFCLCDLDDDFDIDCDCYIDDDVYSDPDTDDDLDMDDTTAVDDGDNNDLHDNDTPDLGDDVITDNDSVAGDDPEPDDDPAPDNDTKPDDEPVVDETPEPDNDDEPEPDSDLADSVVSAGALVLPGASIIGFYHYRKKSRRDIEDTVLLIEIQRERCQQSLNNIKINTRNLSDVIKSTGRRMRER